MSASVGKSSGLGSVTPETPFQRASHTSCAPMVCTSVSRIEGWAVELPSPAVNCGAVSAAHVSSTRLFAHALYS